MQEMAGRLVAPLPLSEQKAAYFITLSNLERAAQAGIPMSTIDLPSVISQQKHITIYL
jgi:hypothetical protein